MKRTLFVSVFISLALLILSSCDPAAELSYIEFQGVRYSVSGAVNEAWDNDGAIQWDIQIGTGDRVFDNDEYYWSGMDPVLFASLYIALNNYDYDFEYVGGRGPGTYNQLSDLELEFYLDGEFNYLIAIDDPQNLVSVSETEGLFVVVINVLMEDGMDGSAWLTGRFVGDMTGVDFSLLD